MTERSKMENSWANTVAGPRMTAGWIWMRTMVADGKDSFASKIREQLQRAQTIRNEVREEKQRRAEAKKEKREAEAKAKGEL